ncbi:hypothetical protein B0H14DRAFT_562906 [Mycena olivaceomarginata]|nr:hypothetical protein B0H14DRAFT_562906 [Mycena olivaceomarginata]
MCCHRGVARNKEKKRNVSRSSQKAKKKQDNVQEEEGIRNHRKNNPTGIGFRRIPLAPPAARAPAVVGVAVPRVALASTGRGAGRGGARGVRPPLARGVGGGAARRRRRRRGRSGERRRRNNQHILHRQPLPSFALPPLRSSAQDGSAAHRLRLRLRLRGRGRFGKVHIPPHPRRARERERLRRRRDAGGAASVGVGGVHGGERGGGPAGAERALFGLLLAPLLLLASFLGVGGVGRRRRGGTGGTALGCKKGNRLHRQRQPQLRRARAGVPARVPPRPRYRRRA